MSISVASAGLRHSSLPAPSSSAAGIVGFLTENDDRLKVRALQKLHQIVDLHWAEVCDSLPIIEALSEDGSFSGADLAASVASKCFFHLQEYNESLRLALSAGKYFDILEKNEYIETLLAKCIDEYTVQRRRLEFEEDVVIDPRMEGIIEQMFQRCYRDGCYEQAIGIALDTRRIDKVEEVCSTAISSGRESILNYTFNLCQAARNIDSRGFRLAVITNLVQQYSKLPEPDHANVCVCLQYLDRPSEVANYLHNLCKGSIQHALQAYQIAFDMQETENQGFILNVVDAFPGLKPAAASAVLPTAEAVGEAADAEGASVATATPVAVEEAPAEVNDGQLYGSIGRDEYEQRLVNLRRVLIEGFETDLYLNYLFKLSQTEVSILNSIKSVTHGAVVHNAIVVAHAYMNSGTTQDIFLRDNLDWLGRANNWSKFTAVASMGVVHKGQLHESMNLLQPYLPQGGNSGASPFSESGAFCALGLIHANKGGAVSGGDTAVLTFLKDALRNSGANEVVQHGACLGIGLAAMATGDAETFETLANTMRQDFAVAGEAASLSIGLLLLGQCDSPVAQENIPELITYAHDTHHEKIIRALALSIAMMVYGKEESADALIEQLCRDRDPIIRYGGVYAVAMAYCGTGDNRAVRRLLHVAVSDVSDDVRRAAVTCLGFLLFRSHESVPKLVSLLAESFNPHVRYGACLAVGISCAGTAFKDAIDLLQPMFDDAVDFVRQGAYMAMALVLMQVSEARSPSVKKFRELMKTIIADKHQPIMAKTGAILATGIIDAGGRNVVVSLQSKAGFMKMGSVVGVMLWLQYWYWYPLMLFLSLAYTPTLMIGLNKDFDVVKNFNVRCNAPPSMFSYPKIEEKKEEKKELVATAVLSTTARAKAREARKEAKKLGKSPSLDSSSIPEAGPALGRVPSNISTASYLSVEDRAEEGKGEGDKDKEIKKKEKEPSWFTVSNPSRIVPSQVRFISTQPQAFGFAGGNASMDIEGNDSQDRYAPIGRRGSGLSGVIMLSDRDPEAPEDVFKVSRLALGQGEEADMPEPFVWDPSQD